MPDLRPGYNLIRLLFGSPTPRSSVIASEAKQSIGAMERKMDCFVAVLLAMTAMDKESNDV